MDLLNSSAMLAIFGYFGFILKDIPNKILSIILPRISTSISWDSGYSDAISACSNAWIRSKDKDGVLSRHFQFTYEDNTDDAYINTGSYYIRITRFIIANVYSYIETKNGDQNGRPTRFVTVTFYGPGNKRFKQDYMDYIEIRRAESKNMLGINTISPSGGMMYSSVPKRPFTGIFSPYNEEIKMLCDKFEENKKFYNSIGLNSKIGFLLYGPPGSGKSSISRAIASYMSRDIFYVNLNNTDISCAAAEGKVVLLEDIDCVSMTRTSNNDKGTDMHTLLNFLDGPMSPENVVFIATTNHIENLDPALIRAGRFDHHFFIDYIDEKMAKKMCKVYESDESVLEGIKYPISPAVIQERIIRLKNSLTEEELKKIC